MAPVPTSQGFFAGKQPAAVLKHELLARYVRVYVQKTGSTSKDKRVAYVDGYAGPGTYDDGTKGSPAVAVEIAKVVRGDADRVDGYFIEADTDSAFALSDYFEREGLEWPVYNDLVESALPEILDGIDPATSLFVFLDPFGLGVPMELLARILKRSKAAPTEALLNFSYPGLRRNAGQLTSTATGASYLKARDTIIRRVDRSMGGDWWQAIWLSGSDDRERQILKGYLDRIREVAGRSWGYWSIPVSDRWMGPPDYSLIQLTQHPDGRWHFHEALSNSLEVYREFCFDFSGQLDFEPLADREAAWVAEITANVERMLAKGSSFVVQSHIPEIFGEAVGFAREKHLRRAIKALYKQGKTSFDGVGKLQRAMVRPPV